MILDMNNDRFLELAEKKGRIVKTIKELCKKEEYGVYAWMVTHETPTEIEVEIRFHNVENYFVNRGQLRNQQTCISQEILKNLLFEWVIAFRYQPEEGYRIIVNAKEDSDYLI